jgi:hypothetical protein
MRRTTPTARRGRSRRLCWLGARGALRAARSAQRPTNRTRVPGVTSRRRRLRHSVVPTRTAERSSTCKSRWHIAHSRRIANQRRRCRRCLGRKLPLPRTGCSPCRQHRLRLRRRGPGLRRKGRGRRQGLLGCSLRTSSTVHTRPRCTPARHSRCWIGRRRTAQTARDSLVRLGSPPEWNTSKTRRSNPPSNSTRTGCSTCKCRRLPPRKPGRVHSRCSSRRPAYRCPRRTLHWTRSRH